LLDLFGGSPCNSVLKLLEKYGIECVVGVNLPMLLETVSRNDDDISAKELAEIAYKAGVESVRNIGVEFRNRKKSS
jgi:mannose/fructose-specific phosphotransferase system component IIA